MSIEKAENNGGQVINGHPGIKDGERAVLLEREEKGQQVDYTQVALCGDYLQNVCHNAAANAGWWIDTETGEDVRDWPPKFFKLKVGTALALIHSEVSEGLEGHRKGLMDDKLPHRTMLEVELADVVIRVMDLSGAMGLDVGGAIAEKLAFNAQRPDHKIETRVAEGGKSY